MQIFQCGEPFKMDGVSGLGLGLRLFARDQGKRVPETSIPKDRGKKEIIHAGKKGNDNPGTQRLRFLLAQGPNDIGSQGPKTHGHLEPGT